MAPPGTPSASLDPEAAAGGPSSPAAQASPRRRQQQQQPWRGGQQHDPQQQRRRRRPDNADAPAAPPAPLSSLLRHRPVASALVIGFGLGLLAGGAWHSGRRQQTLLLASAGGSSSPSSRIAEAVAAAAAVVGEDEPKPQTSPSSTLPAYPDPPPIPPTEKGDAVHVVFTSNGSPYGNFQGRLHYASFLRAHRTSGGGSNNNGGDAHNPDPHPPPPKITAFTRILHRSTDDGLAREIPTFRADPLEPACDTWCEFPVKDRAHAVAQWLAHSAADASSPVSLRAPWVLMLETDYVWRYPIHAPGDASDPTVRGQAFLFDYMAPMAESVEPFVREMCAGRCAPEQVLASGPAPVMLRASELRAATPEWVRLSAWIEANKEAREALGWVREMYAWDVAVARAGVRLDAKAPPDSPLCLQPPHDALAVAGAEGGAEEKEKKDQEGQGGDSSSASSSKPQPALFHYTWGAIFHEGGKDGKEAWRFDKRDYTSAADAERPPALTPPPEWAEGRYFLQDGAPVTRDLRDTLAEMVGLLNAAGAELLMHHQSAGDRVQRPAA